MATPNAEGLEYRVLILAPTGRDAALARRVLEESDMAAEACPDIETLCARVEEGAGALLLTDEALGPNAVARLSEVLSRQPPWSDLPVLVFSSREVSADVSARTREQLGALSNIIFLDRPTRKLALLTAAHAAMRARRRQYEVRDLLLQLERAVRDRDHFLAMLGHELRNPLGAILASVQLMEQRQPAVVAGERKIIQRQTELLSRLVDDLLDVSRVTSGKIALERELVDLRALVARCVQSHRAAAAAELLDVTVSGPGGIFVEGDPVRLEQIVNNLLTNALKYTPPGGRIAVGVRRDGDQAELRVADSGVGMDPSIIPRVFDLFMQADDTLDRAHGGLGIGLTLVRSLVELHGGTVRAESRGRGQGSEFVVRLPASAPVERLRAVDHRTPRASRPRRILLIEDNADVRQSLAALLEEVGHRVASAGDGLEGIELAASWRPEVALVDIGLPRLDGYGVARRLRQVLGEYVFLVALTGYGLPEDRRRALEGGFDAHLTKPVTLHAVLALLDLPPVSREAGAR